MYNIVGTLLSTMVLMTASALDPARRQQSGYPRAFFVDCSSESGAGSPYSQVAFYNFYPGPRNIYPDAAANVTTNGTVNWEHGGNVDVGSGPFIWYSWGESGTQIADEVSSASNTPNQYTIIKESGQVLYLPRVADYACVMQYGVIQTNAPGC